MEDNFELVQFFQSAINRIELIYSSITGLFGDESSEDGLFSYRASLLHQFAILASAYHQLNTLDFLGSTEEISMEFNPELDIANYRTRDYEHRSLKQIESDLESIQEYLDQIIELSEEVSDLHINTEHHATQIESSYYEDLLLSVAFYLQEINNRILLPAGRILQAEVNGANKVLKLIGEKYKKNSMVSSESVARMCEVLSWGLEIPPGWKSIQSDTSELTGDLEKKIGSLKALSALDRPF